jgi:hypothetical protein
MPHPHSRRRGPKPDRRRALELLAASLDGCTEALMFANGFTAELLVELVRAGLASAHAERLVTGGKMVEVARVKISEAGWRTLGDDAINGRAKSTRSAASSSRSLAARRPRGRSRRARSSWPCR